MHVSSRELASLDRVQKGSKQLVIDREAILLLSTDVVSGSADDASRMPDVNLVVPSFVDPPIGLG